MECRASTLQICRKVVCACLARASDRYAHVEAETSSSSIIGRAFAFSSFLRFTRAISNMTSDDFHNLYKAKSMDQLHLSTTCHVAPSMLVMPEARVADKSKKGKAMEKETVQDTAVAVVEAVPGTKKTCKPRTCKTWLQLFVVMGTSNFVC